eukprot:GSA25T00009428001.1
MTDHRVSSSSIKIFFVTTHKTTGCTILQVRNPPTVLHYVVAHFFQLCLVPHEIVMSRDIYDLSERYPRSRYTGILAFMII